MTRLSHVLVVALLMVAAAPGMWGHETITTKLTWTRDIQRIFIKRCMSCHQAGGAAPFALSSWKEARPWAVAIREEVAARRMPPVNTVKGFGDFRDDPALTQEEIQLIMDWANGGAPEGDPRLESDELPRLWKAGAAPEGERIVVRGVAEVGRALSLLGLVTPGLSEGVEVQAVLERADGSLEPLAWIRNYRPGWARPLVFQVPVEAPAGSRIRMLGAAGAVVEVVVAE
jgi:hypothetical protein